MVSGIDNKYGYHPPHDDQDRETVSRVLTRFDSLRSMRSNYESVWDEITDFIIPSNGTYSQLNVNTPAQRRDRKILDITGIVASRTLAARVITEMTSPNERWFNLSIKNPILQQEDSVRRFLFDLGERVFETLSTGWQLPHIEVTTDWVAYGTACLYVQKVEEDGVKELAFKAIPIAELFIAENFKGVPDTVFRYFKLPIRQIAQEFGIDNFTKDLLNTLNKDPDQLFEVIHAVYPSDTYVRGAKTKKAMKFKSCYVLKEARILLSEGGFKKMPFIVFRFWKRTGEPYGGSPAWDALSDVRMINAMSETSLRAFQMEAFPPWLAASDGVVMPLKTMPNGVNIGGMSPEGKRLIEPMVTGSKTQLAFEVLEQRRQSIRNAFFVDPLINRENSIRTAAEVQKRASEELNGIGPFVRRYEKEYLEPLLDRVLDFILEEFYNEGNIPPELQGQETKIEYTAPLARTHRAKQLDSSMAFMQMLQMIAQSDPSVMGVINKENLIGLVADLLGVPYFVIKTQEELMAEQQAQQQQQMMDQLMQAGPALAQTAKGTSEAMKNLAQTSQVGLGGEGQLNLR